MTKPLLAKYGRNIFLGKKIFVQQCAFKSNKFYVNMQNINIRHIHTLILNISWETYLKRSQIIANKMFMTCEPMVHSSTFLFCTFVF